MIVAVLLSVLLGSGSDVSVTVNGVDTRLGNVHVYLCQREEFLRQYCALTQATPPDSGELQVVFLAVQDGEYAAMAWQDRDADGNLDMNWIGYPSEPMGVANVRCGFRISLPRFERSAFVAESGETPPHPVVRLCPYGR